LIFNDKIGLIGRTNQQVKVERNAYGTALLLHTCIV
jgi:hypothetical protein